MAIMTAQTAARLCEGRLIGDPRAEIKSFVTDSRKVTEGAMFVALKGENTDGNRFLEAAVDAGASCVLGEREAERGNCIVVPDALKALQLMSKKFLDGRRPRVFAVTGSVGKTTTKEFIYSVISHGFVTQKTIGNYNSIIGLPLTVLDVKEGCEALVLEMGMSGLHEIEVMSDIAKPDVAVITNIGTSHMQILGSQENILKAKLEITTGMSDGAYLILNGDDRLLWRERERLKEKYNVLYYAYINGEADYRITNPEFRAGCFKFDLKRPDGITVYGLSANTVGMHNVYNAAAAYICGRVSGMNDADIKAGIAAFENTGMRQKVYKKGEYTILADCYNAAPESMKASLSALMMLVRECSGRTHALLGQMNELGDNSAAMHRDVGMSAFDLGLNYLYTYGEAAKEYGVGALIEGMNEDNIICFEDNTPFEEAAKTILDRCLPNDVILFKASHAVGLERAVEAFEKLIDERTKQ